MWIGCQGNRGDGCSRAEFTWFCSSFSVCTCLSDPLSLCSSLIRFVFATVILSSICLSVLLSACPSVFLSVCSVPLFVCLSTDKYTYCKSFWIKPSAKCKCYVCPCPSVCRYVPLFVFLSICLLVFSSVCDIVCMCVCLFFLIFI